MLIKIPECCDTHWLQYNIRYLKAGLRLVLAIASLGHKCSSALVKHGGMEKLYELLEADQMASTLKLLVLRAMDSLLDYPQGMEMFFGWSKVRMLQNMRS